MIALDAPRFGTGIGLGRTDALLTLLEVDRRWLSDTAIAVTGSNGKGSTTAAAAAIGDGLGLKTGAFTSPHLFRPAERFQVGGREVDPIMLDRILQRVVSAAGHYRRNHAGQQFSVFELLFAASAVLFAETRCDLCIYEAGIGGRYDPVRLTRAQTAAVTSLDLEHTSLLGTTLEQICLDKTDICAEGGRVFYGPGCAALTENICTYASLRNLSPVIVGDDQRLVVQSVSPQGTTFSLQLAAGEARTFMTPLIGAHQAHNAALALLAVEDWWSKHRRSVDTADAAAGLTRTRWPGRLEVVNNQPLSIIDVGHTPDGVRSALSALRAAFPGCSFVLVCGTSFDKDAREMLEILAPSFDLIVATQAHYRGKPPHEIVTLLTEMNPDASCVVAEDIVTALRVSRELALARGMGIYVAGGMYLAAEFAFADRGGDPRTLPHLF